MLGRLLRYFRYQQSKSTLVLVTHDECVRPSAPSIGSEWTVVASMNCDRSPVRGGCCGLHCPTCTLASPRHLGARSSNKGEKLRYFGEYGV